MTGAPHPNLTRQTWMHQVLNLRAGRVAEEDADDEAWHAELDDILARFQTGSGVADDAAARMAGPFDDESDDDASLAAYDPAAAGRPAGLAAAEATAANLTDADDSDDDSDDEALMAALDALAARRRAELEGAAGYGEATEPLTAEAALECLTEVRDYYRNQVKSFNKVYVGRERDDQQAAVRNGNAAQAHGLTNALRSDLNALRKRNDVELGQYLVEQDIRYGACAEMTAVAAFMADRRSPGVALHSAETGGGFSHRFLVTGPLPQPGPIQSWESHPDESQTCVIDAWMNISCRLADYPARVKEKLDKWAGRKKRILDGAATDPRNTVRLPGQAGNEVAYHAQVANAPEFIDRFLQSPCAFFRSK